MTDKLQAALDGLPILFDGPGGAAAVLRDGRVLASHAWGWADIARAIPFTQQTLFPICSITKQFTCATLLDRFPDVSVLNGAIAARMPLLAAPPPVLRLCHNQSGLRDYWATAMLCGAQPEQVFTGEDARRLIGRTRSLHFEPGTRYSYANQNFRLLSDVLEENTGRGFGELLRDHVFTPAGMPTAVLGGDTAHLPGDAVGYEGTPDSGFVPAVNRIHWTGDAGISASLDDMIAWEAHIDATRDDPASLYARLSAPVTFAGGQPARYGFGLRRGVELGLSGTGHGGGLRGWRSVRFHIPAHRVSVVVLFNHFADAGAAARHLLSALDLPGAEPARPPPFAPPDAGWSGAYEDSETGLGVRLEPAGNGQLRLHYGTRPDMLDIRDTDTAEERDTVLHRRDGSLWLERSFDNQVSRLAECGAEMRRDIEGDYASHEYGSRFTCVRSGRMLYGVFEGDMGRGEVHPLLPLGTDAWRLPCRRALDFAPPGEWTVRVLRDGDGAVSGVEIGCWLARRIAFRRVGNTQAASSASASPVVPR